MSVEQGQDTCPSFGTAATPTRLSRDGWSIEIDRCWSQGRTLFGGLVAANAHAAMSELVEPDQRLRSIALNFLAPLEPGTATLATAVDRRGKWTTFTSATVSQGDQLTSRIQAIYGGSRESDITVSGAVPPLERSLDEAPEMPYIEGLVPVFLKNFEIRWGHGDFPYSGSPRATLGGYCRHREPVAGAAGILGLLRRLAPRDTADGNVRRCQYGELDGSHR